MENNSIAADRSEHVHHCLAILRHAVMCAGDTTLEELDKEDLTSPYFPQRGNSGFSNIHVCRNWTAILEAAKVHSILKSDKGWIALE
jgi:hypothetical protein